MVFLISSKANCAVFSFEVEPNTATAEFPSGTMFKVILQETISSKINKIGDPVSMVLVADVVIGKSVCIPKDSVFLGNIVELEQAQEGRDGYFKVGINELIFSDGWRTPLHARVWDKSTTDLIGGQVTQRTEYTKVPHYIENIGPIVKLVQTGPRAMGQERALPSGLEVIIVLEKDLQVKYLEKL